MRGGSVSEASFRYSVGWARICAPLRSSRAPALLMRRARTRPDPEFLRNADWGLRGPVGGARAAATGGWQVRQMPPVDPPLPTSHTGVRDWCLNGGAHVNLEG